MNVKIAPILEKAKANFWFIPSLMIMTSILMAGITVWIDMNAMWGAQKYIPIVYSSNVEAIRSLLGTIAGSMITVTSIAFSITIVSLTMASAQFGPRVLRNFMMDRVTQVVLGIFTSNFLFCILVFCAISLNEPYQFTPGATLIWAILMTCVSVGYLILFIHHVAKSIQADTVIDDVFCELNNTIDEFFPEFDSQQQWSPKIKTQGSGSENYSVEHTVRSIKSGYVQLIDTESLTQHLLDSDCLLALDLLAGDYINKGEVLAVVRSCHTEIDTMIMNVQKSVVLGSTRTPIQDPKFAVRQLVEIALRALSPGINDPGTAIACVDKLGSMLCDLTHRQFPGIEVRDTDEQVRIERRCLSYSDIGKAAFDQIRQHAWDDTAVTIRLIQSLKQIAIQARDHEQYDFVSAQLSMITEIQQYREVASFDAQDISKRILVIEDYLQS